MDQANLPGEGRLPEPYFDDGVVRIYHGDNREVLPLLTDIGLVVTSPPYNLGRSLDDTPNEAMHNRGRPGWDGGHRNQRFSDGYAEHTDDMPLAEYQAWQSEVLGLCWDALNAAGAIYYNHKPRVQRGKVVLPTAYLPERALLRQVIIWDRITKGMAFVPQAYNTGHEWVLLIAKPAFRLVSRSASAASDIWRFPPDASDHGHPCPFPLGIPATAIATADFTGPVLDPFMGSGTTLVAAREAGRKAIGIELSEAYCEAAVRRLSQGVFDFGEAS